MTTYVTYQCSTCRRFKDIALDTVRALPNKCTITKGCSGFIIAVSETQNNKPTLPVAGVEDWYARSTSKIVVQRKKKNDFISVNASANDGLVFAIQADLETQLPDYLDVEITQRRAEDVSFQEFEFSSKVVSASFSGKDSFGKILRFDAVAIAEDRVSVRLNGVQVTPTLTPNTVVFSSPLPINSQISIRVLSEKQSIDKKIRMFKNSLQTPAAVRGSWSNVQSVDMFNSGQFKKWWIYSIDSLGAIGLGKFKIKNLGVSNDAVLLLSHPPHGEIDRYLTLVVPLPNVIADFNLIRSSSNNVVIDMVDVAKIFPPIIVDPDTSIILSVFLQPVNLKKDEALPPIFTSSHIIGPV